MTTTDTLSISETLTVLRASNKQLTKELRKAKDKLERKDLLIVELQKRFKDYSEYEKWVNHKENYKQELENKIRTRQEELQELKELGLTNLDILQRETRLKNAESELSAIEARIKSRNAVLFKVEPKANRLRELESSIDMIAKNLAKQGAHLYDTLEQITSLYDSLLPPNPTSAEATD